MVGFVGRRRERAELHALLDDVRRGTRADRGIAVLIRGRRRVGKSRLVVEFLKEAAVPSVYFQAARGVPVAEELAEFAATVAASDLPDSEVAVGQRPASLTAALALLAAALPSDAPAVVVIDEAPWLLERVPGGAGELQRAWDRQLASRPVLLLLLGSDLAAMEQLGAPDQPFHGRATELVLAPLSPADIADLTGLAPMDAVDAYLITGGMPLVAQEWPAGATAEAFLRQSFTRSTSALVVSGQRVLDSEFPAVSTPRAVLTALGGRGERSFTGVNQAVPGGPLSPTTLSASLRTLTAARVVAEDRPLSARSAPRDRRWRIADPGLRFWLAFVEPALAEVDRGQPELAVARVQRGYQAWRGRAVEPMVREALQRLLPDDRWPRVARVGGWWPRSNTPEIDLVGADAEPARTLDFVGTVKWRPDEPVTAAEVARLATDALAVPGVAVTTELVAVCPAGAQPDIGLAQTWTVEDLLHAWR
ncbi:MAG: ATP-binding protein [Kineosporiaceae bacterium]